MNEKGTTSYSHGRMLGHLAIATGLVFVGYSLVVWSWWAPDSGDWSSDDQVFGSLMRGLLCLAIVVFIGVAIAEAARMCLGLHFWGWPHLVTAIGASLAIDSLLFPGRGIVFNHVGHTVYVVQLWGDVPLAFLTAKLLQRLRCRRQGRDG